jgi:hypothetical protein
MADMQVAIPCKQPLSTDNNGTHSLLTHTASWHTQPLRTDDNGTHTRSLLQVHWSKAPAQPKLGITHILQDRYRNSYIIHDARWVYTVIYTHNTTQGGITHIARWLHARCHTCTHVSFIFKVGKSRICTLYMVVCMVIALLKLLYIHRIHVFLYGFGQPFSYCKAGIPWVAHFA